MVDPGLGPFDPGQVQIHDFNPGDLNDPPEDDWFQQGGLFWTANVPRRSVSVRSGRGDASFHVQQDLFDFFDVPNSVFRNGPPRHHARAEVRIDWHGTGDRLRIRNRDAGFFARYERTEANVFWRGENLDTGYSLATADDQVITSAFIARVRSGSFFR